MIAYDFRPMCQQDLSLVRHWLAQPHVAQWWHDAQDFEFVSGDLAHPDMAQFIVAGDGQPFAYLQCYRLGDWHASFQPQPAGTRGLDQIIGPADMVGHGHGSAFIRAFAVRVFGADTPRLVVDPDPDNIRAIRAYEKTGFARDRQIETPDGPALLMVRTP